jgi:hypothetical protein
MAGKTLKPEIVLKVLVLFFFGGLFLHLTLPLFDHDFWWHLATGKWMWQNGSLMHSDPFNFPSYPADHPTYQSFFLKQYWLSQLVMYGVHSAAGFKGLIILRASAITLTFYTLYALLMRFGAGRAVSAALVFASAVVIIQEISYVGMRPQIWTSLFSLLLIYLFELQREGKGWARFGIPGLMLLWGNMHGGYILGDVIIAIYVLAALVTRTGSRGFYVSAASAIALSGLNPAGLSSFAVTWMVNLGPEEMKPWQSVSESQSLFRHSSIGGILRTLPFVSGIAIASLASFAVNIKGITKIRKEFLLLYALALFMGAMSIRFIPFFAAVASIMTAVNLRGVAEALREKFSRKNAFRIAAFALTAALVLGFTADQAQKGRMLTGLRYEAPYVDDYAGAVSFIKKYGIGGNAFNEHGRGGYLIWWLWPEVKVFMDGRVLYLTAFEHYAQAMQRPLDPMPPHKTPAYKNILYTYGVDLAVLSGCDRGSGIVIPLSHTLIEDDEWAIVYADAAAIVFMRKTPDNAAFINAHSLPKTAGYENILAMASAAMQSRHGHGVPGVRRSLAVAYMGKGDKRKAHYWINEYLKLRPGDQEAQKLKYDILMMEDTASP